MFSKFQLFMSALPIYSIIYLTFHLILRLFACSTRIFFSFSNYVFPKLFIFLAGLFVFTQLFYPPDACAATSADPKTENVTVSASIADNTPPTTPILISPTNSSYVTTGYVTFVWQGSTDENGIKEYELSLDGSRYIASIPPNAAETTRYIMTYDSLTNYYTLRVKELIADGSHTWKIRVNDMLDNGTDSATWSFTVDTQGPSFVLTQVGELTTAISAQDISTVPPTPLELENNEPQLLAHGEANSTVILTVTIPADPTQTWTATTDENGNWGQLLGILPRDVVITLDFVIADQAGLISVLNNVQLIIKTQYFVYPPASPTPSPTAAPIPGVVISPTPTPFVPVSSNPPPLIAIPLTPPVEIAHEIFQEVWERIPTALKSIVASVPFAARRTSAPTAVDWDSILALLILIFLWLLALLAMLGRFGKSLSPQLIWRSFQALHLWPILPFKNSPPQGIVYDSHTHQGIPFALIEVREIKKVTSAKENATTNPAVNMDMSVKINTSGKETTSEATEINNSQVIDAVVTDRDGFYHGISFAGGELGQQTPRRGQLVVIHPHSRFPTNQARPQYLTLTQFYRGENFTLETTATPASTSSAENKTGAQLTKKTNAKNQLLYFIPLDLLKHKQRFFSSTLTLYSNFLAKIFLPLFATLGIVALTLPSCWNWLVFGSYTIVVITKAQRWFKQPSLTGNVIDEAGRPLANVIVAIVNPLKQELIDLTQTNQSGEFATHLGQLQQNQSTTELTITKPGFVWVENDTPVPQRPLDRLEKEKHLIITLKTK